MPNVKGRSPKFRHLMIGLLMFAACSSAEGEQGYTPTPSAVLIPFRSPATGGAEAQPSMSVDLDDFENPTPTPFLYEIKPNDTVFGLAAKFSISQDAILAANPGLNPRLLTPGTEIVIPVGKGGEVVDVVPTPTPVPAELRSPDCYTNAAGQLTCFLLLSNDQEQALENVSALLHMVSGDGERLVSVEAVAPLNLLRPGFAMPLMVFVAEPPKGWSTAQGQLRSAFLAADTEGRYIDVDLVDADIDIEVGELQAVVRGGLELAEGQSASLVWVLAVAYDEEGRVVGVRRWEGDGSEGEFELWVYSLGPEIARVELLAEARP